MTRQTNDRGAVHGATFFTYADIGADMDESPRTIEKWMTVLKREGYIGIKYTVHRKLFITILNQKKFGMKTPGLFDKASPEAVDPEAVEVAGNAPNPTPPVGGDESSEQIGPDLLSRQLAGSVIPPVSGIDPASWRDSSMIKERIKGASDESLPPFDPNGVRAAVASIQIRPTQPNENEREKAALSFRMFEEFWTMYPTKTWDKDQTKGVFDSLSIFDQERARNSIAAWIVSPSWEEPRFIPHPKKFLRSRMFESLPPANLGDKRERKFANTKSAIERIRQRHNIVH